MIKRSFSVVMLALMVAPTYAMYGAGELPPTPSMKDAQRTAGKALRSTFGSEEKKQTPSTQQNPPAEGPKKTINSAKENLSNHIEEDKSPSENPGASSSESDEDKKPATDEDKGSEIDKTAIALEKNKENKNSEQETKPGFFSRCTSKVVGGFVSSKNAVVGGVSAFGAVVYAGASKVFNAGLNTGKFAVATVDPRTYWNAGKAVFKGQEGVSRFAIIKGHKEAVTGIVAATLASVGYVYREEIVEYGKKAYDWSANQVQTLRNYIQGQ